MTTAAARLATLSGLSGVSAAIHLNSIKQSGTTAGAMLLSRSSLSTGTAAAHLLSDGSVIAMGGGILVLMRRRRR